MKKVVCAAVAALLALSAATLTRSSADDKKAPTIKEIMTEAHKGGTSLIQTVGKELKADEPEWDDVQKKSKRLLELGEGLGKNTPPKGEKPSWERLTKQYVANAKALSAAADKKDKSAAASAHTKLAGMCMSCHRAHRG